MTTKRTYRTLLAAALLASPPVAAGAVAQEAGGAEIRIGNVNPYTGPAAAYGATIGRVFSAFFGAVNDNGGIGGRPVEFISYDDGYNPAKTLEQARRLVEQDDVLLIFQSLGTAHNLAIRDYMNGAQVPQLFVGTGGTMFGDPGQFPWTIGWQPSFRIEGLIFAEFIKENHPDGTIAVLYQNDAFGADGLDALRTGLGPDRELVALPYETSDASVDSQIINLKASGAAVLVDFSTPKFAAQAIRKAGEIGWRPAHLLSSVSNSVGSVMQPAGLDNATGVYSVAYYKDPTDPTWAADPAMTHWKAFMQRYLPEGDPTSGFSVFAYAAAETLVEVLEGCAADLTRTCVMAKAADLHDFRSDLLLPGITINTGPDDFFPIEQMQMVRFNGRTWELIGSVIDVTQPTL